MRLGWSFGLLFCILCLSFSAGSVAADETNAVEIGAECGTTVPPLISLEGIGSFYEADATQSVIDPELWREYSRLAWQYDALLNVLLTLQKDQGTAIAYRCGLAQLEVWATAGALTEGVAEQPGVERRQAAMIRAWVLSGSASFLLATAGSDAADDPDYKRVTTWMNELAHLVREEFQLNTNRPEWLNRTSNHSHWAGLAMLRVGLLTKDETLVAEGLAERDAAIAAISQDGSLDAELGRGSRALSYTNFALTPIMGLVDLSAANSSPLSASQTTRLERAVDFAIAVNRDPRLLEDRVGIEQVGYAERGSLAWVRPAERFLDRRLRGLFASAEPDAFESVFLGYVP